MRLHYYSHIHFILSALMSAMLETQSSLTDRYQTTVPETVRRALKLGKRDKIHYAIHANGEVVLSRVDDALTDDPALDGFLTFLSNDIASHPERIQALDKSLVKRIRGLVGRIEVDLGARLSADDE